ncbi:TonB-dependent receptor [Novosphingobium sp. YJ-S2-02]|uniref:TonB-dependent receptor n=1 Tax=Novosphingobium aureum TaxID=2792964 RepID=A0A931MKJ5_9SPHN|nr:TonB-dependent receptor [Novosphingobium aureum]MBH0112524.1 TonB-dependent receptor [Novosphingobium aureum]
MRTSLHKAALYGATCLTIAGLVAPGSAFAQDADDIAAPTDEATDLGGSIVVTGSRISRPNLDSPVPVTAITSEEITSVGDVSLGDALNDLPALRTTYSQGNSTRFIGTAGLNLLDLRGLGTSRTLVLVNGRRHVTSSPGDYLVDTNTIPVDLLERVDIVTGGSSAIYGSDAVAGVVNFVLKRDFEGLSLKGQGGISSRGDRGNLFVSGTFGKNFADGRGNIAIAAEYAKSNPLYYTDRDYLTGAYSGRCQYNYIDDSPVVDGTPDYQRVCGVRNGSISDGGTVGGLGQGQYLRFDNDGDLFVDVPDRYLGAYTGNVIGGNGSTLRNTGQLAAGLERYNINMLAHFDVSDAFRPYVEAKYVHIEALQEGQPSFFVGGPTYVGGPAMRCDNAFLNAQALGTLQSYGLCTNVATGTFPLSRFNIDFGGRGETHERDTYRIVGGVQGDFLDTWSYDLSVNYGRLETKMNSINNLLLFDIDGNPAGFNLAIDAVRDATGNIVCRVNADANPANDAPGCVPINVLGYGAPSQEALDFVNTTAHRVGKAEQFIASGSISGDLGKLFELPGGPVAFALGAEYRKETASESFDALTASGGTFLNAIQPFNPPAMTVKEAFGEINVPILADMPFAELLSVGGAARVSDYNNAVGSVWAYNISGVYAPVQDLRFRVNYATSVRTPTQSDLYSPFSQNFAQLADPCDSVNIGQNPNRAANCAAAGVPTSYNPELVAACSTSSVPGNVGDPFRNCLAVTSSTPYVSGGNSTLTEERGKSLTIGAVFQPRWIPGLALSVDYYNIKVSDLIASLSAQNILNLCYNSPTGIDNQYCQLINRDATTGLFVEPAVVSGGVNYASQKTEGIDFDLSYRHAFDNGHSLSLHAIVTRVLTLDNYTNPTYSYLPNRQLSELGDPKWAGSLNVKYDMGPVAFTWQARLIGKTTKGSFEAQNEYTGLCPNSGETSLGTCTPGELTTLPPDNPDMYEDAWYPTVSYHNFRVDFNSDDDRLNFYLGMDNAFDKKPPFGLLGTSGGDPYDTFGRYLYAGFKVNY